MQKENKRISKSPLKKRQQIKPARKPVTPAEIADPVSFQRIHLKSYRQVRGTVAKLLKALVLGQLTADVVRASVQLLDRALAVNHALLLQARLQSVSEFLQMDGPPDTPVDDPDTPDEPETEEPEAEEEE
jgi:hypothetical protein